MKRSRLNLFKATSMTISILGIIMILATVGVFAYIGVQGLSSKVSSNVDSGAAYDQLAALKSEYSTLSGQFETVKKQVTKSGNQKVKKEFYDAQIELVKANSAVGDVESALSSNLPVEEVNRRISTATNQLQIAKTRLNTVKGQI
ncbi:hypothetical protein [Methanobacterium sp. ACI-7]|uniref:hypothetical protein n=1 Tax=unclassified Methanobacterium TaxID=2627676 RepID=UPI0039C05C21